MQVELHPLLPFRLVLTDGPRALRDAGRFDLQLPLVGADPALDHKTLALLDGPGQFLSLVSDQKFGHPDGIGLIRNVKADDPCSPLLHLQMVGGEYISFNGHHLGIQGDVVQGDSGKLLHHTAVDQLLLGPFPAALFLRVCRRLDLLQRRLPDALRPAKDLHRIL